MLELFRNHDDERMANTVEALWQKTRETYPHPDRDESARQFWRKTVTGAMFAANSTRAVSRLEHLYIGAPQVLATLANGAWSGLRDDENIVPPEILLEILSCAATSINESSDNRLRAWRVGGLVGLLTIWMHDSTDIERTKENSVTELAQRVIPNLLQSHTIKTIRNLPLVISELGREAGNDPSQDPWLQGILSKQLVMARLRMLYGLRGKEFDVLAVSIDETQGRINFRDPERWTVNASDAGYAKFDAWRRDVTGTIGTSLLAKIAIVKEIDTITPLIDRLMLENPSSVKQLIQGARTVSYTHLTLPTTPYV